jgi:hypothetical protein
MSGGGSKTQTSTTSQEPYGKAKPLLNTAMKDAMSMYKDGSINAGQKINTAVPFSQESLYGLQGMENNARNAAGQSPFRSMLGNFADTYGQGGFNDAQRTAMDPMTATARGDYLNRVDPNFEKVLRTAKEGAGADVNSMMAGMGRFAGGAHQGVLADKMGNMDASARLGQYNTERDRQMSAASSLFGMGQQGMNNVANAGDVWTSLLAGQDAPLQSMMGIGGMKEDLAGRQLNDQIRQANLPMSNIQSLLGVASGAGGYGTSTAQTPQQNNTMSNIGGGLLGGASLLSMMRGGF